MEIGQRIKEARENKNLTQSDLSEYLQMDQSQFSKIERGKIMPTLLQIIEISKTLHRSIDWFVFGVDVFEPAKASESTVEQPDLYKEMYILSSKNAGLLQEINNLKDKIHKVLIENSELKNKSIHSPRYSANVAEPESKLNKEK